MHLSELKAHHVTQLVEMAVANGIENASRLRKQDLIFALLKSQAKKGVSIFGDGTLEVLLIEQPTLQKIWVLRKLLFPMDELEAAEFLIDKLRATKQNAEFFDSMRRG
jgi:transcription termination factor Rho